MEKNKTGLFEGDNLLNTIVSISKGAAYDAIAPQVKELQEQNALLLQRNKELLEALQWIEMKSWHKNEWIEMEDINEKAKATIANNTLNNILNF
jgi:hypothetical protein